MTKIIEFYKNSYFLEIIKWFSIGTLILLTFINYYCTNLSLLLRVIIIISLISLTAGILYLTKQGKKFFLLIYESKKEIKKITWPNLRETFHTTVIVIIATFIISLSLWGLDNILIQFVSFVTSLRL
ncbi:MAG: preprotein translocase subunit SecE [Buchnera aphidicola (Kaburagia rhusicola rhusicola)]